MRGSSFECALLSWHKRLDKKRNADARDISALGSISRLYEWCIKRGWKVEIKWHGGDTTDFNEKTVVIDKAHPPRVALYFFLHECGHILFGPSSKRFDENYGENYYSLAEQGEHKETLTYRIAVAHEEMEAWTRGFKLAKRLEISIDTDDYSKYRIAALKSYLEWTLGLRK